MNLPQNSQYHIYLLAIFSASFLVSVNFCDDHLDAREAWYSNVQWQQDHGFVTNHNNINIIISTGAPKGRNDLRACGC